MKKYTWADISVFQWQSLIELFTEEGNTWLDNVVRSGAIVTGKTEHEIDSMTREELVALSRSLEFLHTEPPATPARHIDVNGRRYRCVYDVRRMPAARYIESKHFGANVRENLHRLAASMVWPQKRVLRFGPWVDDRYDASRHAEYAEDMLAAPITAVLGSVVFFCEVYLRSMMGLQDYSVAAMLRATPTMTREQAETQWENLCVALDGTIRSNWSHGWRASN